LAKSFIEACMEGDMEALLEMLSEDITLYSDGGGKARAALRPIHGVDNVARFLFGIVRKAPPRLVVRQTRINGQPGILGYYADGRPQSVTTLEVAEGRIGHPHRGQPGEASEHTPNVLRALERRIEMLLDKLRAYGKTFARARYDEVPDLLRLLLKRPAILMGLGTYETALLVSSKANNRLKVLATIKTSSLVGCPF
jgi:hypothetical protein